MQQWKTWLACGALALASVGASAQSGDARVKKLVGDVCSLCHGAKGESSSDVFPRLAGQHAEYIAKQLDNFKSGKRKSDVMGDQAAKLSPEDMLALGKFFEKQPTTVTASKDPSLAAMGAYIYNFGNKYSGIPACASCHGPQALGTNALPRLAGQVPAYIENQLKLFSKRERTNDNAVMHAIVVKLTPLEMAAVAEYVGGK